MDLKFSFGASNPLPLNAEGAGSASLGMPGAGASVLILRVAHAVNTEEITCEALSGDGVSYARAQKQLPSDDLTALANAVRSVIARAGAELPEPLIESVTGIELSLNGQEREVLDSLGLVVASSGSQLATVDALLQSRTGVSAGTPITLGA